MRFWDLVFTVYDLGFIHIMVFINKVYGFEVQDYWIWGLGNFELWFRFLSLELYLRFKVQGQNYNFTKQGLGFQDLGFQFQCLALLVIVIFMGSGIVLNYYFS